MISNFEFVTLARVVKTQGRNGEVAAEVHTDVPERFRPEMKVFGLGASDKRRGLEIEAIWPHKGLLVFKFRGINSISQAEELVGCELQIPRSERATLERGWTYVSDLIGCSLLDHGRDIGCIDDVQFGAGEAPLLVVADQTGRKFEVPFAEAYLETVDVGRRQVRMSLPEGMFDINGPMTQEEKKQQSSSAKKH